MLDIYLYICIFKAFWNCSRVVEPTLDFPQLCDVRVLKQENVQPLFFVYKGKFWASFFKHKDFTRKFFQIFEKFIFMGFQSILSPENLKISPLRVNI